MNILFYLLTFCTISLPAQTIPKDAVKGDYNGDGKKEYAWVSPPAETACSDCGGVCNSIVHFSDRSIKSIRIKRSVGGDLVNLGDLNKDGADEIGFQPGWCSSCWSSYNVYTLGKRGWVLALAPFSTHCNQWESGVKPVERDEAHPGHVLIRYSVSTEDGIVVKTKSVPIK